MFSLKDLAFEYGLSEKEILEILELPLWHLENGLENYQFNGPMRECICKELEAVIGRKPTPPPIPVPTQTFSPLSEEQWHRHSSTQTPH